MFKKVTVVTMLFLLCTSANAARIYFQDFETGSDAGLYGSNTQGYYDIHLGSTGVVSDGPYAGTYSFRGSISENGTLDNLLNEPGTQNAYNQSGNPPYTFGATDALDVYDAHTNMISFRWQHKFDTGELANLLGDTHKVLYAYTQEADPRYSYIILRVDENGRLCLLTYENGLNQFESCGAPYTDIDMQGIDLDDGNWHEWMVHIAYGTGGNTDGRIRIDIDGTTLFDDANLWTIETSGDRVYKFALPANISNSSSVITTVGYQLDNLEVWDELPPPGIPDTTAPSVPSNLQAVAVSTAQIDLTWDPSSDTQGVTGYRIFQNGSEVGTADTESYFTAGLDAGATYTYTLTAYDAAGNESAQCAPVSMATMTRNPDTGSGGSGGCLIHTLIMP